MTDFRVRSPDAWQSLDEIRRSVRDALCMHSADVQDAAAMTASELVENAMRHGDALPETGGGRLTVSTDTSTITITVESGAKGGEGIERLTECVERIRRAGDPRDLYLARLREYADDPGATGKLGLLRIAFEGRFDIRCAYCEPVLTMTAKRVIS